jgi:cob(I)alamin adenosyltransferase
MFEKECEMKIYTKTGDNGTTSLLTGERVKKSCLRVDAYGTVDEANSALGLARASASKQDVQKTILKLQKMMPLLMAELASGKNEKKYITIEHVAELENMIDEFSKKLEPCFIIPGDKISSAFLDLARTTIRRAERETIRLVENEEQDNYKDNNVLPFLNRLSDLCFVLSRFECEDEL